MLPYLAIVILLLITQSFGGNAGECIPINKPKEGSKLQCPKTDISDECNKVNGCRYSYKWKYDNKIKNKYKYIYGGLEYKPDSTILDTPIFKSQRERKRGKVPKKDKKKWKEDGIKARKSQKIDPFFVKSAKTKSELKKFKQPKSGFIDEIIEVTLPQKKGDSITTTRVKLNQHSTSKATSTLSDILKKQTLDTHKPKRSLLNTLYEYRSVPVSSKTKQTEQSQAVKQKLQRRISPKAASTKKSRKRRRLEDRRTAVSQHDIHSFKYCVGMWFFWNPDKKNWFAVGTGFIISTDPVWVLTAAHNFFSIEQGKKPKWYEPMYMYFFPGWDQQYNQYQEADCDYGTKREEDNGATYPDGLPPKYYFLLDEEFDREYPYEDYLDEFQVDPRARIIKKLILSGSWYKVYEDCMTPYYQYGSDEIAGYRFNQACSQEYNHQTGHDSDDWAMVQIDGQTNYYTAIAAVNENDMYQGDNNIQPYTFPEITVRDPKEDGTYNDFWFAGYPSDYLTQMMSTYASKSQFWARDSLRGVMIFDDKACPGNSGGPIIYNEYEMAVGIVHAVTRQTPSVDENPGMEATQITNELFMVICAVMGKIGPCPKLPPLQKHQGVPHNMQERVDSEWFNMANEEYYNNINEDNAYSMIGNDVYDDNIDSLRLNILLLSDTILLILFSLMSIVCCIGVIVLILYLNAK